MIFKYNVYPLLEHGQRVTSIVASLDGNAVTVRMEGGHPLATFPAPTKETPWTESPPFAIGIATAVFGARYVPNLKWPYLEGDLFRNGRSLRGDRPTLEEARAAAQPAPLSATALARLLVLWLPWFLPLAAIRGLTTHLTLARVPALVLVFAVLYGFIALVSLGGRRALARVAKSDRSVGPLSALVALVVFAASLGVLAVTALVAAPYLGF